MFNLPRIFGGKLKNRIVNSSWIKVFERQGTALQEAEDTFFHRTSNMIGFSANFAQPLKFYGADQQFLENLRNREAIEKSAEARREIYVLLSSSDQAVHNFFNDLAEKYPANVKVCYGEIETTKGFVIVGSMGSYMWDTEKETAYSLEQGEGKIFRKWISGSFLGFDSVGLHIDLHSHFDKNFAYIDTKEA